MDEYLDSISKNILDPNTYNQAFNEVFNEISSSNYCNKVVFNPYQNKNINTRPLHDKFSFDNIVKKVKYLSINIIINNLNLILKDINIPKNELSPLKPSNPKKSIYVQLLESTLKDILSSEITSKSKYEKDHNKELINKIYEIYEKGSNDKKIKDLVNFLNMKYEDFWKELNNNNNTINLNENTNEFFSSLIKDFNHEVDDYLNNDKEKKETYKDKFKEILKDIPGRIKKMK